MTWQVRHEGSPRVVPGLTLEDIVHGLRDGSWEPTDEVMGPGDKSWTAIENHPQLAEYAMEVEPSPATHHVEATSIDMNALIDVCLVLLIFFILTTAYATAVQKVVPMPAIKSEADDGKVRVVRPDEVKKRMIHLQAQGDAAGKLVFRLENAPISVLSEDGRTLDGDKLRKALEPHVRGQDGKHEVILDAQGISWGMVIAIQDAARSAGVRTVHHLWKKSG
jgi:biopolymer transport protein ExbD